jgi:hypothetical protein
MAHQAQETFVAELESGPLVVARGQVFADSHAVVKLDGGRGILFKPLDLDEPPAKAAPAKTAAKPAAGKAS